MRDGLTNPLADYSDFFVGPIVVLFLILTFVPCIFNKLVTFVKDHINTVHIMMLQQYIRSQRIWLREGHSFL